MSANELWKPMFPNLKTRVRIVQPLRMEEVTTKSKHKTCTHNAYQSKCSIKIPTCFTLLYWNTSPSVLERKPGS